jgi:hypothetical protein
MADTEPHLVPAFGADFVTDDGHEADGIVRLATMSSGLMPLRIFLEKLRRYSICGKKEKGNS